MFLAIHVCAESVLSIVGGMLQPIFGGQATGKCLIKLGPVVSLMAAGSTGFCVYEEELRDLLTYDCPVTGRKRCPPYSDEWMGINKTRKTLRCTKQCLPNISFKTVRCHACIFLVETLDVLFVSIGVPLTKMKLLSMLHVSITRTFLHIWGTCFTCDLLFIGTGFT